MPSVLARAESPIRRLIRPALWLLVIVPAIVLVAQLLLDQLGAEPIEELEHASGKWALRLLAASLAVTPLMRLTGWGWMVAQRRFLGLAAFFWALGHLSVYIVLDQFFDWPAIGEDILKRLYITLGMLAFVLMIPLALTSTKAAIRKLGGKRWNLLHRLVYVSAIAGCIHFLWAVKKDLVEPIIYVAVFVVLFALRFIVRKPGPRAPRSAPPDAAVTLPAA
ncbi:protein-methionine-sulfoxide reductase heme-binding subunit MsrQ [Gemmatimonas sp.]|uniref:sulfite oxidase heme-binding subunit YedZ n=1 Tax=Gemmatimonas sp. TaxID=1962908 RepID=UPI00286DBA13|nr:protein-methionine-sulfoxide reductase heme-binding subunit MsrQ [Gemmatimonas sp.]